MKELLLVALMFGGFAVVSGLITTEQRSRRSLPTSLLIGLAIVTIAGTLLIMGVFN